MQTITNQLLVDVQRVLAKRPIIEREDITEVVNNFVKAHRIIDPHKFYIVDYSLDKHIKGKLNNLRIAPTKTYFTAPVREFQAELNAAFGTTDYSTVDVLSPNNIYLNLSPIQTLINRYANI